MTLRISKVFTYDEDAGNYIQAVEAADGQVLEGATRKAINNFVIGCKQDGIWSAFEQCGILCGARTRQGAVIPLVKPSGNADPTFHGSVGGWTYNRKTGLAGNGTDNYIDTKYVVPSGNQNNCHAVVWKTTALGEGNPYWIGSFTAGFGQGIAIGQGGIYPCSATTLATGSEGGLDVGLHGFARSASNAVSYKRPAYSVRPSTAAISATPATASMFLFNISGNGTPGGTQWSSAPLGFYSAGKNVDLLLLSVRVTALINALSAAIP